MIGYYTTYSILSGSRDPSEWSAEAAKRGHKWLAMADKGTQAGHIEHKISCEAAGLTPYFGQEFEVYTDATAATPTFLGSVQVYATNEEGYANLIALNNFSQYDYTEGGGFKKRPRVGISNLLDFNAGTLLVTTGVDGFPFYDQDTTEVLRNSEYLDMIEEAYGDRYFIGWCPMVRYEEVMKIEDKISAAKSRIAALADINLRQSKTQSLKKSIDFLAVLKDRHAYNLAILGQERFQTIPFANTHYLDKHEREVYKAKRAIDGRKGKKSTGRNRNRVVYNGYLPTSEEWRELCEEYQSKSSGDLHYLGEKRFRASFDPDFEINTSEFYMPQVDIKGESVKDDLYQAILRWFKIKLVPECDLERLDDLEQLRKWGHYLSAEAGKRREIGDHRIYEEWLADQDVEHHKYVFPINDYIDRLKTELHLIESKGYLSYFHVVNYIYEYVRRIRGAAGPARGSAGGSLVAYCLGINKVDPLRHSLLFERFLSWARQDLPDIDMDFSSSTRDKLVEHLLERFGERNIVNIATYARFKIRSCINNLMVATGYKIPDNNGKIVGYSDRKIKNIMAKCRTSAETRGQALLEEMLDDDTFAEFYLRHQNWFDDIVMPLQNEIFQTGIHAAGFVILPEAYDRYIPIVHGSRVAIQFPKEETETRGFPKFDLLVIDAAEIIEKCRHLIRERHGVELPDEGELPLTDPATIEIFHTGDERLEGLFQFKTYIQRVYAPILRATAFEHNAASVALNRPGPMSYGADKMYAMLVNGEATPEYKDDKVKSVLENTFGLLVYQETIMRFVQVVSGFTPEEAEGVRKATAKKKEKKMLKYQEQFIEGGMANGYEEEWLIEEWNKIVGFSAYSFNLSHSVAYTLMSYTQAFMMAHYPIEYWTAAAMFAKTDVKKDNNLFTLRAAMEKQGYRFVFPSYLAYTQDFEIIDDHAIAWGIKSIGGVGKVSEKICERGRGFDSIGEWMRATYCNGVTKREVDNLFRAGFFSPHCLPCDVIDEVRNELYSISRKSDHLEYDEEWATDDPFYWAKVINKQYKMQVQSWKDIAPFDRDVQTFSGGDLQSVKDGTRVKIGGRIRHLEYRTARNGNNFAKIWIEDLGEEIKIMAWSGYWDNSDLDELMQRPEKDQIVQFEAIKDSWSPKDSDRVYHSVKMEEGCESKIIWREKSISEELLG